MSVLKMRRAARPKISVMTDDSLTLASSKTHRRADGASTEGFSETITVMRKIISPLTCVASLNGRSTCTAAPQPYRTFQAALALRLTGGEIYVRNSANYGPYPGGNTSDGTVTTAVAILRLTTPAMIGTHRMRDLEVLHDAAATGSD
jgi:hypothetical protein